MLNNIRIESYDGDLLFEGTYEAVFAHENPIDMIWTAPITNQLIISLAPGASAEELPQESTNDPTTIGLTGYPQNQPKVGKEFANKTPEININQIGNELKNMQTLRDNRQCPFCKKNIENIIYNDPGRQIFDSRQKPENRNRSIFMEAVTGYNAKLKHSRYN